VSQPLFSTRVKPAPRLFATGVALCIGLGAPGVGAPATAAAPDDETRILQWCMMPGQHARLRGGAPAEMTLGEEEPNSDPMTPQTIPLGDGPGEARDIDIAGVISTNEDRDYFRVELERGDFLGVAALGDASLDPLAGIVTPGGERLLQSIIDTFDQASFYPDTSPLPGGASDTDAVFSWVAPADGEYLILVESLVQITSGAYTLQIRQRRAATESAPPGGGQVLFFDFDGAVINAESVWGDGEARADLSPLSAFLPALGLAPGDEDALIDATMATIAENFADIEDVPDAFSLEIQNSRDDPDPGEAPTVSRVIIGGTQAEIGFPTIGRASAIDPGNFSSNDVAVVLLDLLSADPDDFQDSLNAFPVAGGLTRVEFIGRVLGNAASHEAGHFLGNWHTTPDTEVRSLMDQGAVGLLPQNLYGVGPDGVAGSSDDVDIDFVADDYSFFEEISFGIERTDLRTGFALSAPTSACIADLDGDGDVGSGDLATLLAGWGAPGPADLNGSGVVEASDLAALLGDWGPCP